ncbi:unnamed protein product [Linum trigynum]|uniref:Uncharacterized protein n=1 Tax=Linum trigynum TaxID=586398 RepID=A0AAV2D9Q2_9ROSI
MRKKSCQLFDYFHSIFTFRIPSCASPLICNYLFPLKILSAASLNLGEGMKKCFIIYFIPFAFSTIELIRKLTRFAVR